MARAKTPELEVLRRLRIALSKLGKKRGPVSPAGRQNIANANKKHFESLSPKQQRQKIKKLVTAALDTRSKRPQPTPEQKKARAKRYRETRKAERAAEYKKWVGENLERRGEIARESAKRRRLAKKSLRNL
jgi:hypothetical protein